MRFSPGSAGINSDELNFILPTKNVSDGIANLKDYVVVVGIYGDTGFGKSSFARMIVEHLNNNYKILYSYISLTETNEAKDFSKIFSDRWCETLGQNYPKINTATGMALTSTMLRESGNSSISEILNQLSKFDVALVRTRAKVFDKNVNEPLFVSGDVAKSFGNIPRFNEDMWVIMIDEIERSQLDEIYRVTEVIERFKIEGRTGLPLKIVFIICLSNDFQKLLSNYKNGKNSETAHLIENFFIIDPKSVSQRLFLPPVDKKLKRDFILSKLIKFKKDYSILGSPNEGEVFDHNYIDPSKNFLDEKNALEFIVGILRNESPRLILRCLQEMEFFYNAYRNSDGVQKKDDIRFCDILTLSYIRLRHPYIIEFFKKTIDTLLPKSERELDADDFLEYMEFRKLIKDKKQRLFAWVEQELGIPHITLDGDFIEKLIGACAHFYFDAMAERDETGTTLLYDGTTSDATKLKQYLLLVADKVKNPNKLSMQIYTRHEKEGIDVLIALSNDELLDYSRFLRSIKKADTRLNLNVAHQLCDRIILSKIPIQPRVTRDTIRDGAIYQFSFQILEIMERQRTDRTFKEETKEAIELFKRILSVPEVDTGSKYKIINSFVNSERAQSSSSDINFRLVLAFEKMVSYDKDGIYSAIRTAFKEVNDRYFDGNKVIYENEENFFYVLYQSWSGDASNSEEIEKIRKAAKKDLNKYPDVVAMYWERYPYIGDRKTYEETTEDRHFFANDVNQLPLPLENLLEISEKTLINDEALKKKISYWKKIYEDKESYQKFNQRCAVRNDNTLKGFLIRSHIFV